MNASGASAAVVVCLQDAATKADARKAFEFLNNCRKNDCDPFQRQGHCSMELRSRLNIHDMMLQINIIRLLLYDTVLG